MAVSALKCLSHARKSSDVSFLPWLASSESPEKTKGQVRVVVAQGGRAENVLFQPSSTSVFKVSILDFSFSDVLA
jgi:hypothetical protein